jgi:hypothetical protein
MDINEARRRRRKPEKMPPVKGISGSLNRQLDKFRIPTPQRVEMMNFALAADPSGRDMGFIFNQILKQGLEMNPMNRVRMQNVLAAYYRWKKLLPAGEDNRKFINSYTLDELEELVKTDPTIPVQPDVPPIGESFSIG